MRLTQPWSARYPIAVEPLYVTNGRQAWRASLSSTDPWTQGYLGAGARSLTDVPGAPGSLIGVPAPLQAAPAPVTISRGPDDSLIIRSDPSDRQQSPQPRSWRSRLPAP